MFRLMSDIKLVLYKENRAPRSIALSTRMIYRTLSLAIFLALLAVACVGLAARFYVLSRAKMSQPMAPTIANTDELGPSNSLEEQNHSLRDQIEQLKARLQNQAIVRSSAKDIDKTNPALALFSPNVTDKTHGQDQVVASNFKYTKGNGKTPSALTFQLNNAHPDESVEKGYIVVLARNENGLYAYPNVFDKTGTYLLDFEKGETFQVARFRLVNAQFGVDASNFQILIFTRKGELLINAHYEVKNSES